MMRIASPEAKKIMEYCKSRARDFGLRFSDETLEYFLTNMDLLKLLPRHFIPTLYRYWVDDVAYHREVGIYDVYPHNPYEVVVNTRPPISFYNECNLSWTFYPLCYHVLAHIHICQNNVHFRHTWHDDFRSVSVVWRDKIEELRRDLGERKRMVDYVIEFARSMDNLVGIGEGSWDQKVYQQMGYCQEVEYFFQVFLEQKAGASYEERRQETERFAALVREMGIEKAEKRFLAEVSQRYPDFQAIFEDYLEERKEKRQAADLMEYVMQNSEFLRREENQWMLVPMQAVHETARFFAPMIRTKILHEGAASLIHHQLFSTDPHLRGYEDQYAVWMARVTAMPRGGMNPYALGKRLLEFMCELADKGRLSYEFQRLTSMEARESFDKEVGKGKDFLFWAMKHLGDYTLINFLSEQDFQDFVRTNNLVVLGQRINPRKGVLEYYIKSKSGKDYRRLLNRRVLYHPPHIKVREDKSESGELYLEHIFEGKGLKKDWIPAVLRGISFLWGGPVAIETTEIVIDNEQRLLYLLGLEEEVDYQLRRVVYRMEDGKLSRKEV